MEQRDNLLGVVQPLWQWRKPILLVCVIAVVGTAIISLFLPNYYKSSTVFLATSPDQAKPDALFASEKYYGNANDVDRLLTIAESNELVEYLIDTFNLYEHYGINPNHSKAPHNVRQKFFSLYEVKKNKRDAIELSVEDRDRALAAKIANTARERIDEIAQRLVKEGQRKAILAFQNQIQSKQQVLQQLTDTLVVLRSKYGIYNTESQTETLTEQQSTAQGRLSLNRKRLEILKATPGVPRDTITMLNALVFGLEEEVKNMDERISHFNNGMAIINIYERQWFESNLQLTGELERLKIWRSAYEASVPAVVLVESAEVPIIKSRPKRSILVLTAGVIAFVFSVIAVLLLENYNDYWQTTLKPVFSAPATNNHEPDKKKKGKNKRKQYLEKTEGEAL